MKSRFGRIWVMLATAPIFASALLAAAYFWPVCVAPVEIVEQSRSQSLEANARATLSLYCQSCHAEGRSGADFNEATLQLSAMRREKPLWQQAVKKLRAGTMPPRNFPQPSEEDRHDLIRWIEQEVLADDADARGPLMARRLLRSEYQNAIRDLFGPMIEVAAELPADERGWDRRAKTPVLDETQLLQYRTAACAILDDVLAVELADADPADGDPHDATESQAAASPVYLFVPCGGDQSAEQARKVLASFAQRAYRRPINPSELERLTAAFEQARKSGASYEDGMRAALLDVLTSPSFLYRIETRGDASLARDAKSSNLALASRLSFLLWSSAPDAELLDASEKGMNATNLDAQVRRMLKDPRSQALAVDFANHWLSLAQVHRVPKEDRPLAQAMRLETELFFTAILQEDRSVLNLIDADFTFVNDLLAKHYGINGVESEAMRRITLQGEQRGGLLTQGSFLKLTSRGEYASPVLRGKWIMENFLAVPPVRPPPGLLDNFSSPKGSGKVSVREQMRMHRADANCAACHVKMDTLGITLDNYGPAGAWRTISQNSLPVEPIGELEDGETLNGVAELKAYLLRHRKLFVRSLAEKLLAYALDRKLSDRDRAALRHIPDRIEADGFTFSRLIQEVAQSEPFRAGWQDVNDP